MNSRFHSLQGFAHQYELYSCSYTHAQMGNNDYIISLITLVEQIYYAVQCAQNKVYRYVINIYIYAYSVYSEQNLSKCSSIIICFCKHQLLLVEIKHVINFSQSQLLLAETNEDRTACRKVLLCPLFFNKLFVYILFLNIEL